jgi:UDP-N-acetylglucosamine:LPS N-acetylglucosamine transferase
LKISDSWTGYDVVFVTTNSDVAGELLKRAPTYIVGECNRNNFFKVAMVFWRCMKILYRTKPNVIISTGAAAGCILCFLGKLKGAKIIWLDSITNRKKLSLSGRMVRVIADLFIVQWPELAAKYSNVEYVGSVI